MNETKKTTIGQAIDQTISALTSLDKREQQIVITTVCSLLDVAVQPPKASMASPGAPPPQIAAPQPSKALPIESEKVVAVAKNTTLEPSVEHALDIRSLKNLKQPASAIQMACVAAFYLQEHAPADERTKEISNSDLDRLFKQAGFKLPSRIQQVLPDGKSAGYFESVDRGKYKLSRVGYNLVTHSLPKAAAA